MTYKGADYHLAHTFIHKHPLKIHSQSVDQNYAEFLYLIGVKTEREMIQ